MRTWHPNGVHLALSLFGVCLVTGFCFPLHVNLAIPGFLYLLLVVRQSLSAGFASAAIVSIVAVACLDYFFVPPVLTWNVTDPLDGLALVTYLLTSLVITRLASRARKAAQSAERNRQDIAQLYEAASRLLSLDPETAAGQLLRIFREEFGLSAACLFQEGSSRLDADGDQGGGLVTWTRRAYWEGRDFDDAGMAIHARCLRISGRVMGAIGFEGVRGAGSILGPLSLLAATTLERARSFRDARDAAAAAQTEALRTAFVDAFAHEFKTPLGVIMAAADDLRRAGAPTRSGTAEIIETEVDRLNDLATRMLRMARLDAAEVKPRMEHGDLADLVEASVDRLRRLNGNGRIALQIAERPVPMLSDPELLSMAVTQLLENALKYSPIESPVSVRVEGAGFETRVSVTNKGTIAKADRERIFDRFYRGSNATVVVPGTGVGLYVARKIVVALGGTLELDCAGGGDVTFSIRLPAMVREMEHEYQAS